MKERSRLLFIKPYSDPILEPRQVDGNRGGETAAPPDQRMTEISTVVIGDEKNPKLRKKS